MQESIEPEARIDAQQGQPEESPTRAIKRKAEDSDRGLTAPGEIDADSRQPGWKVGIVAQVLGVVHEVQQARGHIQEQEPDQQVRPTRDYGADGRLLLTRRANATASASCLAAL